MEVEAKFAVPDRATHERLRACTELAGFAIQPQGTKENVDRYLDTADRRFQAAGYFCRLRREGEGYLVTLKGLGGATGAIHRRDEREVKLEQPDLDPRHWPDSPATWLAQEIAGDRPLAPLFELRQMRDKRLVRDGEREVAELSADAVAVDPKVGPAVDPAVTPAGEPGTRAGGAATRYYELEIELKGQGTEADLERMAGTLQKEWGLQPEPRSKFERAAATLGLAAERPSTIGDALAPYEQSTLEEYARGPRVWARRASVVLGWAAGQPTKEVASSAGLSTGRARFWVRAWRGRRLDIFARKRGRQPDRAGVNAMQAEGEKMVGPGDQDEAQGAATEGGRAGQEPAVATGEHGAGAGETTGAPFQPGPAAVGATALASAHSGNQSAPQPVAAMPGGEDAMTDAAVGAGQQLAGGDQQGAETQAEQASQSDAVPVLPGAEAGQGPAAEREEQPGAAAQGGDEAMIPGGGQAEAEAVPAEPAEAPGEEVDPLAWLRAPVAPEDAMPEAGRKIMWIHFQRMCENEEGTRSGEDPENLHDMRVSTRRLRAAYLLFEPYYESKAFGQFNKQLRKTGRTLGAVRDLDVLIEKAERYQQEHALPEPGLAPLAQAWHEKRDSDREILIDYLDGKAYRNFTADFEKFLTTPGAGARPVADGEPVAYEVRHVVPRLIMGRYEDVRAYERLLPNSPLATYHQLRITCKKLRYAMEFFKDVMGNGAGGLIKQVVGMQDLLGNLQDASVAENLIAEFLASQARGHAQAIKQEPLEGVALYLAAQWNTQRELLGQFAPLWSALIGYDFRRSLSLALAEM